MSCLLYVFYQTQIHYADLRSWSFVLAMCSTSSLRVGCNSLYALFLLSCTSCSCIASRYTSVSGMSSISQILVMLRGVGILEPDSILDSAGCDMEHFPASSCCEMESCFLMDLMAAPVFIHKGFYRQKFSAFLRLNKILSE